MKKENRNKLFKGETTQPVQKHEHAREREPYSAKQQRRQLLIPAIIFFAAAVIISLFYIFS